MIIVIFVSSLFEMKKTHQILKKKLINLQSVNTRKKFQRECRKNRIYNIAAEHTTLRESNYLYRNKDLMQAA